jgi:hypothetical protein
MHGNRHKQNDFRITKTVQLTLLFLQIFCIRNYPIKDHNIWEDIIRQQKV